MSIGRQIYCKKHRRADLDSCEDCDKERENVTYWRPITLSVQTDTVWLTNGWECTEEEGWADLFQEIRLLVRRKIDLAGVRLEAEDWAGPPEQENVT